MQMNSIVMAMAGADRVFKLLDEKPETDEGEKVSNVWPFDQRMHLLINLAWGGSWGGREGTDRKCLPAKLEVDYVHVYQSPEIMLLTGQ